MVDLGSGAKREIDDIALTRYACYLIAQNSEFRLWGLVQTSYSCEINLTAKGKGGHSFNFEPNTYKYLYHKVLNTILGRYGIG